ncbi:MAG: glycosyltransferase family 87 protein [Candidatus Lokiarchaeota archaeon]
MNVNVLIRKYKTSLSIVWENKILLYAVLINLSYLFVSYILFFTLLQTSTDFQIFYKSARVFLTQPANLYEKVNYIWDFRYLPLSTILFIPFSLLSFPLAYIMFNIVNFILNLVISLMIYKIILFVKHKSHKDDEKRIYIYISLFLMGVPHILNYIYGQVNLYVTLFILISLYLFLKNKSLKGQILPSFLLGVSILIKPTALFLIPFLILLRIDFKQKKFNFEILKSFTRFGIALIPIFLNLIPLLMFPKMLSGFFQVNIAGAFTFSPNFSMSLTKNIMNFCYFFNIPFNQLVLLLVIVGIIGGSGFIIYIFRNKNNNSLIFGFTLGILIMFLAYYDTWDHHLLNLIPLLIIIIFTLPRNSLITNNQIKPGLFFLNFFSLIFVGIWYLTYQIFPYNFLAIIAFFILFYGILKYLLTFKYNDDLVEEDQNKIQIIDEMRDNEG